MLIELDGRWTIFIQRNGNGYDALCTNRDSGRSIDFVQLPTQFEALESAMSWIKRMNRMMGNANAGIVFTCSGRQEDMATLEEFIAWCDRQDGDVIIKTPISDPVEIEVRKLTE